MSNQEKLEKMEVTQLHINQNIAALDKKVDSAFEMLSLQITRAFERLEFSNRDKPILDSGPTRTSAESGNTNPDWFHFPCFSGEIHSPSLLNSVGGSSSASSSAINSVSSNAAPSNVFGASWQSPKTSTFSSTFGSPSPSPSPAFNPNPFAFSGQQSQPAPQNPSPFQAWGSLEFNAGGSFSLGSGGGDKSGRKIMKANRNRNRRK